MMQALRDQIREYYQGKLWYWYIPLIILGCYIFFSILRFNPNEPAALIILPAQSLDFGLHEFAHVATAFLPSLLTAAAGSGSELLLGTLLVFGAFKTRCYFAAMFCCLWLMLACQSVGIYMADARRQSLDLVSLGGALSGSESVTHDWNFIFTKLHLLSFDTILGGLVRGFGIGMGLAGIFFAGWLMIGMAAHSDDKPVLSEKDRLLLHGVRRPGNASDQHELYPAATRGRLADPGPLEPVTPADTKPADTAPKDTKF
jgi:hypothetical protein